MAQTTARCPHEGAGLLCHQLALKNLSPSHQHLTMGPFFPAPPPNPRALGTRGGSVAGRITAPSLSPSLCSLPHRLLSNNKITVLENGSFFGLRALEKL